MCLALWASGLWLRYTTLQNLIPSFPWIAPPHPPPWRNPRKGRDQILPSGNLEKENYVENLLLHTKEEGHSQDALCPFSHCGKKVSLQEMRAHYEKCVGEWTFKRHQPNPASAKVSWLPDGYSRIFKIICVWPFGLLDYGSATLRCQIWSLPFLGLRRPWFLVSKLSHGGGLKGILLLLYSQICLFIFSIYELICLCVQSFWHLGAKWWSFLKLLHDDEYKRLIDLRASGTLFWIWLILLQRSARVFGRGCENFVIALAYLLCLALVGSCLARFAYFLANLCIMKNINDLLTCWLAPQ